MIRDKAHEINGEEIKPLSKPVPPVLLPAENVYTISWQGSTGAMLYVIQRREKDSDDWETIDVVNDARIAYRPLYADTSAELGKSYYYRLWAWNGSQLSDISNVIGPILVENKEIVDEMFDDKLVFKKSGDLKYLSLENVRQAKEDRSRLTGDNGSSIIYNVFPGIKSLKVDAFLSDTNSALRFFVSDDLTNFEEVNCDKEIYTSGKNDYGFFTPLRYSYKNVINKKYLKIELEDKVQISRIEIELK